MDDSTRRRFLHISGIAGTIGLTGCSQLTGGSDDTDSDSNIKDSDGDGVIDSEDYAPRDPDVQRAEQVQEVDSTPTETETETPTETETEEGPTHRYTWDDGRKEGWIKTEPRKGYSGHVYKFNIISDNPISGDYSPQLEVKNEVIAVESPEFVEVLDIDSIDEITATFRLEGDLNASSVNNNRFRVFDDNGDNIGDVRFEHGTRNIRWSGASTTTLQTWSASQPYTIQISDDGQSYTVSINGTRYQDLPPKEDSTSKIHSMEAFSGNLGGVGPSAYDEPVYFTWDDVIVK